MSGRQTRSTVPAGRSGLRDRPRQARLNPGLPDPVPSNAERMRVYRAAQAAAPLVPPIVVAPPVPLAAAQPQQNIPVPGFVQPAANPLDDPLQPEFEPDGGAGGAGGDGAGGAGAAGAGDDPPDGGAGGGAGDVPMVDAAAGERTGPPAAADLPAEFPQHPPGSPAIKAQIRALFNAAREYAFKRPDFGLKPEALAAAYDAALAAARNLIVWFFDHVEGPHGETLLDDHLGYLIINSKTIYNEDGTRNDRANEDLADRDYPKLLNYDEPEILPIFLQRSLTFGAVVYYVVQSAFKDVEFLAPGGNEAVEYQFQIVTWALQFFTESKLSNFDDDNVIVGTDALTSAKQDTIWKIFTLNRDRAKYHCRVFERKNDSYDKVLDFITQDGYDAPRIALFWKIGRWQSLVMKENTINFNMIRPDDNEDGGLATNPAEFGTKLEVWRGLAKQTRGGLKVDDLRLNKKCKVVSIDAANAALARYERNALDDDGDVKPLAQTRGSARSFAFWRSIVREGSNGVRNRFPMGHVASKRARIEGLYNTEEPLRINPVQNEDPVPGLEVDVPAVQL